MCFPPPQQPQEPEPLPHAAAALEPLVPAEAEANTDNRLESFVEPQCGHLVPRHLLERTRISLSRSHFSQ